MHQLCWIVCVVVQTSYFVYHSIIPHRLASRSCSCIQLCYNYCDYYPWWILKQVYSTTCDAPTVYNYNKCILITHHTRSLMFITSPDCWQLNQANKEHMSRWHSKGRQHSHPPHGNNVIRFKDSKNLQSTVYKIPVYYWWPVLLLFPCIIWIIH